MILVPASVRGPAGRDTSGEFVLDTGAGYLCLDWELARSLAMTTEPPDSGEIAFSQRPATRLVLGRSQLDQVQPVLLFDGAIVRQVTDRQVIGLVGQQVLAGHALSFRFAKQELEMIPVDAGPGAAASDGGPTTAEERERAITRSRAAVDGRINRDAKPVTFQLAGDGKLLVRVLVPGANDTLHMVLDTGASKSVFFRSALERVRLRSDRWPAARGLVAPTLFGPDPADLVRVPELKLLGDHGSVGTREIDAIIVESRLEEMLSSTTRRPVDGLLGYSFLRRFDLVLDYPNRVVWLTSVPHERDERPYEHSHVGIQLERREQRLTVIAVAKDSPAEHAGIRPLDVLLSVDDRPTRAMNLAEASRALEGAPGSAVRIAIARGEETLTRRMVRKRLL